MYFLRRRNGINYRKRFSKVLEPFEVTELAQPSEYRSSQKPYFPIG